MADVDTVDHAVENLSQLRKRHRGGYTHDVPTHTAVREITALLVERVLVCALFRHDALPCAEYARRPCSLQGAWHEHNRTAAFLFHATKTHKEAMRSCSQLIVQRIGVPAGCCAPLGKQQMHDENVRKLP